MKRFFLQKFCIYGSGLLRAASLTAILSATGPFSLSKEVLAKPVSVEGVEIAGFSSLVQQVSPAVVSVRVKAKIKPTSEREDGHQLFGPDLDDFFPDDHPLKRFFHEFYGEKQKKGKEKNKRSERRFNRERTRPVSQGSGFFISADGYVVTNNHVVQTGQEFTVILHNEKEYEAKLVGADAHTDIALLKIEAPSVRFTYVDFADDSKIRVGDWVVAVGNAFGLSGTVTAGIVSARGRDIGAGPYDDFIQIDAAVNYGNSGGPAFNLKGQVVGVNTAIFSPSGGNVGIAFSIPSSTVKDVVAGLIKDGTISRGWLGVRIQPITDEVAESLGLKETKGALVSETQKDGPGKKAGIRAGDVIIAVDEKKIASPRELARLIGGITPGKTVNVSLLRAGKEENIKVKLELLPGSEKTGLQKNSSSENLLDDLGLSVMPSENNQGLLVTDVDPESIAAERGIQPGDFLYAINGLSIKTIKDIIDQMKEAEKSGRKSVLIQINRSGSTHFVPLPVPKD